MQLSPTDRIAVAYAASKGWISEGEALARLAHGTPLGQQLADTVPAERLRPIEEQLLSDAAALRLALQLGVSREALRRAHMVREQRAGQGELVDLLRVLEASGAVLPEQLRILRSLTDRLQLTCDACEAGYFAYADRQVRLVCPACRRGSLTARPVTPEPPPTPPSRVGPYLLGERLGDGTMGTVFRAVRAGDPTPVALKVLHPDADPVMQQRLDREGRAASRIDHPNVVRVLDFGQDEQATWLAMELVEGEDLHQRMERDPPLTYPERLGVFRQVVLGVEAAHGQGVLHRDLKPPNVLLTLEGQACIADFGLARRVDESLELTKTGYLLGTPYYLSPEQCAGRPASRQSDLYALGVLLHHLWTGHPPFQANSLGQILHHHLHTPAPPLAGDVPAGLQAIQQRLLAKDPKDRFQGAGELLAALDEVGSTPDRSRDPLIGTRLGNLELVAHLGEGGMGVVYRAVHDRLQKSFAVKLLSAAISAQPRARKRFQREARLAASLGHPNIVAVTDFFELEERLYTVMELVEGESLQQRLEREGALPISVAARLLNQCLQALEAAGRADIVHRDLKPANILITPEGQAKITDFGLAREIEGSVLTRTGDFLGTPAYVSPEQCRGLPLDARSDLYSLGATFYHVLTGQRPFEAETFIGLVGARLDRDPPPVRQLRPEIPRLLAAVIARLMARQPEDRFASAGEARRALLGEGPAGGGWGRGLAVAGAIVVLALAGYVVSQRAPVPTITARPAPPPATPEPQPTAQNREAPPSGPEPPRPDPAPGGPLIGAVTATSAGAVAPLLSPPSRLPLPVLMVDYAELFRRAACPAGLVYVPTGAFILGTNERATDGPTQRLVLPGFGIEPHEVTNRQFLAFVEAGGYQDPELWGTDGLRFLQQLASPDQPHPWPEGWRDGRPGPGTADHPVRGVSWYEARAYARFQGRRLPTEAEWEKAARGTEGQAYPWGNDPAPGAAQLTGREEPASVGRHPVDHSPYGCLDMGGNVSEWTASIYASGYPQPYKPVREGPERVVRGGAWLLPIERAGTTWRGHLPPARRPATVGFRCAWPP